MTTYTEEDLKAAYAQGAEDLASQTQQQGTNYSTVDRDAQDQITKWTLDTSDQITRLEQYLQGKEWDEDARKYVIRNPDQKPLMNSAGIRYTIFTLRGILDKNSALSSIDDTVCNSIVRSMSIEFLKNLARKHKEYALNLENLGTVRRLFTHNLTLLLRRSVGAGERNAILRRVSEGYYEQPQRRSGFMGWR